VERDNERGLASLAQAELFQDWAENFIDRGKLKFAAKSFWLANRHAISALGNLTCHGASKRCVRLLGELVDGQDFVAQELRRVTVR
jgi:hypothetical protein